MKFWQRTKSSFRILTDEEPVKAAIKSTLIRIDGSYAFKVVVDFFTAAEIYIECNLAPQERQKQMGEVVSVFEEELKIAEKTARKANP